MALNNITFIKQNGGMARVAASEDPISGLILGLNGAISGGDVFGKFDTIAVGEATLYVAILKYVEQLETLDICPTDYSVDMTDEAKALNFIHYHASEFFKYSPSGTLYLAIKLQGEVSKEEIVALQNYTNGKIRQMGIAAAGDDNITAEQITEYQTAATTLEAEHMPLSILVALRQGSLASIDDLLTMNFSAEKLPNVSIFASQDLDGTLQAKHNVAKLHQVAAIGTLLGCVSAASVHESVAWVEKFPLKVSMPGFVTGDLLKEVSAANLNLLNDENRMIFYRQHVGVSDVYFNDSHTLDVPTSDYAYIENVRTMDKAVRGIRTNLLPYLGAPLKVDADTGCLGADTIALLETVAMRALEDMERAGELSGYVVSIDPEQNVLSTSKVEIIIKNVPLGVMRSVTVKIGFTNKTK